MIDLNTPRDILPRDFEVMTGIPVAKQRLWRQRGYLENIGEASDSGRFRYNVRDCLTAWFMEFISKRGLTLEQAKDASKIASDALVASAFFDATPDLSKGANNPRFVVVCADPKGMKNYILASLDDFPLRSASVFSVIDTSEAANELPQTLRDVLEPAIENEATWARTAVPLALKLLGHDR